jgi:hypothetical protein
LGRKENGEGLISWSFLRCFTWHYQAYLRRADGPFVRIKGKIRAHQLPPPVGDVLALAQKVKLLMVKGFGSAEEQAR